MPPVPNAITISPEAAKALALKEGERGREGGVGER